MANKIIFLDFSLVRCAWRSLWRSREHMGFWSWLLAYRYKSRPVVMQAIADHAAPAELHALRDAEALRRFVTDVDESRTPNRNLMMLRK